MTKKGCNWDETETASQSPVFTTAVHTDTTGRNITVFYTVFLRSSSSTKSQCENTTLIVRMADTKQNKNQNPANMSNNYIKLHSATECMLPMSASRSTRHS